MCRTLQRSVRAVAAIVALLAVAACGDDGSTISPTTSTATTTSATTSVPATSTSAAPGTTTSGGATTTVANPPPPSTTANVLPAADRAFVVWPFPDAGVRFIDPVAAARSFAVDLVGFVDPILGEFQAGDSRSGEVVVKATPLGVETVVLVRRFGPDDTWWVLGSVTANISVDEPSAQQAIDSPLSTTGRSRAFEANVAVEVVADGRTERIGVGFVMGGGAPEFGPFAGTLPFTSPRGGWGCVIYLTYSMKDGTVAEATTVRVGFIGGD